MKPQQNGFTLIELMIAVVIVAILAAIAYPNYQTYVMRARRADAKSALLAIQIAQEKRFLISNTYVLNTGGLTASWAAGGLGLKSTTTDNGYYTLSIQNATPTTYTAVATAISVQAHDACGNFTIDNSGSKAVTGTDDKCW